MIFDDERALSMWRRLDSMLAIESSPSPRHMSIPRLRQRLNQAAAHLSVVAAWGEGSARSGGLSTLRYKAEASRNPRFEGARQEQYYFSSAEDHRYTGQVCFATRYHGATPSR